MIKFIHLEIIVFAIIAILFLICVFKSKKKKYKFQGLDYIYSFKKPKKKVWKYQEKCRKILQKLFPGFKFPSVRPDFLKSPVTGKNLELDCYNSKLSLALEYDGQQHSKYVPFFHTKGPNEFIYQVKKDDWKTKMLMLKGIKLVRVPYYIHESDLESFIRSRLIQLGYSGL